MSISADVARSNQNREIASILASGLKRLWSSKHSGKSSSESSPDALSFRDQPCSVSSTLVNGLREPESRRDTWN